MLVIGLVVWGVSPALFASAELPAGVQCGQNSCGPAALCLLYDSGFTRCIEKGSYPDETDDRIGGSIQCDSADDCGKGATCRYIIKATGTNSVVTECRQRGEQIDAPRVCQSSDDCSTVDQICAPVDFNLMKSSIRVCQ